MHAYTHSRYKFKKKQREKESHSKLKANLNEILNRRELIDEEEKLKYYSINFYAY